MAALRWSRPGCVCHKKPEYLVFEDLPDPANGTKLTLANSHFRFQERVWINLGTDIEAADRALTTEEEADLREDNHYLAAQLELLLDMNTNYELKKARMRQKLEKLVRQIEHLSRLSPDSDSF